MPGKTRLPPPPSRAPKFGEPGYDPDTERSKDRSPIRHYGNPGAGGRGADERQKDYLGSNTPGGGGGGYTPGNSGPSMPDNPPRPGPDYFWLPDPDGGGHWVYNGGNGAPAEMTWAETYKVEGAPGWWKGVTPSTLDPQAEYAMLVNSLIPFMSPEDARIAGANLGQLYPKTFNGYNPDVTPAPQPPATYYPVPVNHYDYLSQVRGQNVLNTLDQVRNVMGKKPEELGPGYQWLRNIASVLRDYGGANGAEQTRAQYLMQQSTLDPLLAQAKGDLLGAYGPAAQFLTQPFSQTGGARDAYKDDNGNWHFGHSNPWLW